MPALIEKAKVRYSERFIPFQATLELTYKCNERCGHCYLSTYNDQTDGRPPLKLEEWKNILDQLSDAGTLFLVLLGGEALLNKDFFEIVDYASHKNFAISLITNGTLITDTLADQIAYYSFYNVTFSVYSLNPEIHDRMTRRKGSHAKVLQAIDLLQSRGVSCSMNTLLTSENIEGYFELEEWANARRLPIQWDPMVTPKNDGSLDSTLTRARPEQLLQFYRVLKTKGRGPQPNRHFELDQPICNQGRGKCAVSVHGDLLTCLEIRDALGSLRESSFNELWNSPKARHLRSFRNKDLAFDGTQGDGAFCDHCPGLGRSESTGHTQPVPFLMELAQIKRRVFEEA